MKKKGIKQVIRKRRREKIFLKLLITACVVLILGTIGGMIFARYLLMQCGYY